MLTLNGKKMAKSTGNFILPEQIFSGNNDVLKKAFSPNVVRFFILQAHYRSILDFSSDALMASEKGFNRLMDAYNSLVEIPTSDKTDFDLSSWKQSCYDAMNDDFNSPIVIAKLFDVVKIINNIKEGTVSITSEDRKELKDTMKAFMFDILGLSEMNSEAETDGDKLSGTIELLIQLRAEARAFKRILSCNPWGGHGHDPVPSKSDSKEG